jgi:hypothetical protein
MSHLLLTQQQNEMSNSGAGFQLNVGPVTSLILMMVLIATMGVLSLTHLNSMSTKGYAINKLEDENKALVEDNEINDMLILNARSLSTIEGSDLVQNMVKPDRVVYFESITIVAQNDTL